jgi:hypothetical protein
MSYNVCWQKTTYKACYEDDYTRDLSSGGWKASLAIWADQASLSDGRASKATMYTMTNNMCIYGRDPARPRDEVALYNYTTA